MRGTNPMLMTGTHDPLLVIVSIIIAVVASYTALDLAGRARVADGKLRRNWLGAAAVAMGGGIWAMHFVAMLAFSIPGMTSGYDLGLTLVSLGVAILATGVSFVVMSRSKGSWPVLAAAGLLMGLGVVAMHYIGMAAMRMAATLSYDPLWLGASILIAIGAATAALWLASHDRHPLERMGAAVVMGVAIAGMHYAGMHAASFTMAPGAPSASDTAAVGQTVLAFAVSAAALLILFLALIAAMFDRRFATLAQREAMALRASEERFRSLYSGTPLPLHSLDERGRIEHVSNTWLELLGYTRDAVIGLPLSRFLAAESARTLQQTDWPELMRQGSLGAREYRAVARDGHVLDVVAAAKVERDETGGFLHVLGGLTDITERKRAEEGLRQAQKIEAIGQLTGGVAHDFNNLLAVVVGNLELLRKRLPDDPRLQRHLDSALEGAQRGASLTHRLLAFARRQNLRPTAVDVPELVHGMTDLLQRSLGPQIRVETRFHRDLPRACVDAHQLEMAILNLAVNARDAMPRGGALDISAEAVTAREAIDVDLPGGGRFVRLAIADDGEGMDDETLRHAVDPFFTTKGVGKGTGLGLSMVQGLAAQSGGRLVLRSVPGTGTVVELYLPVAEDDQETAPPPPPEDEAIPDGPALTIMVVDDDALVFANTVAMLEDLGHIVQPAVSAIDALQQLEAGARPDLLLTDQLMPGMTGVELIEQVRVVRPALPTLLMSGFSGLDADGFQQVIVLKKPFTQAQLAHAVYGAADVAEAPARRTAESRR